MGVTSQPLCAEAPSHSDMPRSNRRESYDGHTFNSILVIKDAHDYELRLKNGKIKRFRQVTAKCLLCDKHFKRPVLLSNIKCGNTKSCGCQEPARKKATAEPVTLGKIVDSYLEVIREVDPLYLSSGRKMRQVELKCHGPCNQPHVILRRNWESVRDLKTVSCGCYQKTQAVQSNLRDYTGEVSGHLEAIKRIDHVVGQGNSIWLCKCSCGRYKRQDMGRWGKVKSCGQCGLTGGRDSYQYFIQNPEWSQSSCTLYVVEVNGGECFKIGIAKDLQARASTSRCHGISYTAEIQVFHSLERSTAWAVEQLLLALTSTPRDEEIVSKYQSAPGRFELRASTEMAMSVLANAEKLIRECQSQTWQAFYQARIDNSLSYINIENISSFAKVISNP